MPDVPYTLIVPSAARPHLLRPTLESLFAHVDQRPVAAYLHDDPVFGKDAQRGAVETFVDVVRAAAPHAAIGWSGPDRPLGHGPALHTLLSRPSGEPLETEYVLYTQDDFVTVRTLPIRATLQALHAWGLHQVRFNKRDTMPYKDTRHGKWYKVPVTFPALAAHAPELTLTVSDHWYFQTSLWRVRRIQPVVAWLTAHDPAFREHAEIKINDVMNGNHGTRFAAPTEVPGDLLDTPPRHLPALMRERDQLTRAAVQRTFIYGGIDEKAYIRHIGGDPKDWALPHARQPFDGKGTLTT